MVSIEWQARPLVWSRPQGTTHHPIDHQLLYECHTVSKIEEGALYAEKNGSKVTLVAGVTESREKGEHMDESDVVKAVFEACRGADRGPLASDECEIEKGDAETFSRSIEFKGKWGKGSGKYQYMNFTCNDLFFL